MLSVEQTENVMKALDSLRMANDDAAAAYAAGIGTPEMTTLETIAGAINECLHTCEQAITDLVPAEL